VKIVSLNGGAPAIKEFWRSNNVREAVGNLRSACDKAKSKTMYEVWKQLWEDRVQDFRG